jgi:ABC-type polysaccharide/polyol phosphate transport system ATPase subunit
MAVIEFNSVSKRYRLGQRGSLRDAMPAAVRRLVRRNAADDRDFWALKDVSFEVQQGEALGIIGPNGAGKSTILKMLAGITSPTTGEVRVKGRVSALIEVGAGFHPDLTGRENVYLNGSILGLSKHETDRKFDDIVSFAGLERFIDTPVKRYSSGMYVRLGFSVAAHVEPDVLLVDEVLSVGDLRFQSRCLRRMEALQRGDTTLILVSHNLAQIHAVSERAILLHTGRVHACGDPRDVCQTYRRLAAEGGEHRSQRIGAGDRWGTGQAEILRVRALPVAGPVGQWSALDIELTYRPPESVDCLLIWVMICDAEQRKLFGSMKRKSLSSGERGRILTARCLLAAPRLRPGEYSVTVGLYDPKYTRELPYDRWGAAAVFSIDDNDHDPPASDRDFFGDLCSEASWFV